MDSKYKYFLYSDEQIKEKNEVLSKTGKEFEPGTVVVNGTRKKFTQMSDSDTLSRFVDTKVVAKGYINTMTFTMPSSKRKGE